MDKLLFTILFRRHEIMISETNLTPYYQRVIKGVQSFGCTIRHRPTSNNRDDIARYAVTTLLGSLNSVMRRVSRSGGGSGPKILKSSSPLNLLFRASVGQTICLTKPRHSALTVASFGFSFPLFKSSSTHSL